MHRRLPLLEQFIKEQKESAANDVIDRLRPYFSTCDFEVSNEGITVVVKNISGGRFVIGVGGDWKPELDFHIEKGIALDAINVVQIVRSIKVVFDGKEWEIRGTEAWPRQKSFN